MGSAPERAAPRFVARPHAIALADPEYPDGLLALADPPPRLYVRGAVPLAPAVAIVGSRAATPYGVRIARTLAEDLARLGITVVSGLARGIDAAAHAGALAAGGTTVAVIPSGLDCITPRHHQDLAREIAGRGAVVSEIASGAPRFRGAFIERNRLIAALAQATVVVEAAERSGALSTAAAARRLGRPLLAVPGDVGRPTARGCHALLKHGARVCEGARDVLDALRATARSDSSALEPCAGAGAEPPADPPTLPRTDDRAPAGARAVPAPPVTAAARLLAALAAEPATVETLAARSGLAVPEALAELLRLEWAGFATTGPGSRWSRGAA